MQHESKYLAGRSRTDSDWCLFAGSDLQPVQVNTSTLSSCPCAHHRGDGGDYTYAKRPLFDNLFGSERNSYDKLGHFFRGFVPAILARGILIRNKVANGADWRNVIKVSVCLAFSVFYELIEWAVALISGDDAEAFLGTQGYVRNQQPE